MPAALQYVDETDQVAVHIGPRILYGIADPRLRRQVDHAVELLLPEQRRKRLPVGDVHPYETEVLIGRELREPGFFQDDRIVIVEIVNAYHFITSVKQAP